MKKNKKNGKWNTSFPILLYFATILNILFLTYISLTIVLPSNNSANSLWAKAFMVSSSLSLATFIVPFNFPLIWTGISISLSIVLDSSYSGQLDSQIGLKPNSWFRSSVIWGAIGFNNVKSKW